MALPYNYGTQAKRTLLSQYWAIRLCQSSRLAGVLFDKQRTKIQKNKRQATDTLGGYIII